MEDNTMKTKTNISAGQDGTIDFPEFILGFDQVEDENNQRP